MSNIIRGKSHPSSPETLGELRRLTQDLPDETPIFVLVLARDGQHVRESDGLASGTNGAWIHLGEDRVKRQGSFVMIGVRLP